MAQVAWIQTLAQSFAFVATLAAGPATAQPGSEARSRLTGRWIINAALSQDWASKIEQSAGPDAVRGGGGRRTLLPRGGGEDEVQRLRLRERVEAAGAALRRIEIEQEPGEFKVISDDDLRIIYVGRKHARQDDARTKIEVESAWEGDALEISEKSENGVVFWEHYSWDPANDQLALVVTVESSLLVEPFQVRTVYDRVQE